MGNDDRSKREALVDQYIRQKNTDGACRLLFDLIVEYAREKDFKKAEALHEKLYEVNPMALTEIVRSGEIIEEEKSQGLDREHMDIWSELYDGLSTSEANALYYSMKTKVFEAGEPILEQGRVNNRLYLINKGEVKAIYDQDGKEVIFQTLNPGDIIGQDSFFSATVCTFSMIAQNLVKVNYLETEVLKRWKTDAPALESKLFDYCIRHDRVKKALEAKKVERRSDKRVNVSGKVVFQLLDKSGKPLGQGRGALMDISAGGLSFMIKSSKKESIRMLLGRRIRVGFELWLKNQNLRKIEQEASVIAAQPLLFDDYSLHAKFPVKWAQKMIEDIDLVRHAPKWEK